MDLTKYLESLNNNHKDKIQTGFEKNDRSIFIQEILGQLGYSIDNIYDDVPQKSKGIKGKSPDIRLYGENERKEKNLMSRCIIETKNYGSLEKQLDKIDFLQLKNYAILNSGKIQYIASTDYISFFLFRADVLLNERKINVNEPDTLTKHEIDGFKNVLVYKFDFSNFTDLDKQRLMLISKQHLFNEYHFPNPEINEDRFNIKKPNVRQNFIRSLFFLMEEVKKDIVTKFENKLLKFRDHISHIENANFDQEFIEILSDEEFIEVRNLLLWAIEMNYIKNFIELSNSLDIDQIKKILNEKNPESDNFFYIEYLVTAIYSIINKTLFIRILEDSGHKGGVKFLLGEKEGRYLSNGIINDKHAEGKLREYISQIFEFKKADLKPYKFLLKHDIYDWVLVEIEEHTLLDFLRTFNEIYLKELDQDILGDIYEHYLQEDTDLTKGKSYRRLLGQYYTPRPIVRFMWALVRDVLKKEKNIDLYQRDKPLLDILDPFMGSGTFLNEAILQMKSADSEKKIYSGEVFHFFKDRSATKKIEEKITGFEINPLSSSIADINIYFRLIKSFSSSTIEKYPIQDLNLMRTNSYSLDAVDNGINQTKQLSFLADDIRSSFFERKKIKDAKEKQYDIIISNPPYGKITSTELMKNDLLPFAYPENNFDKFETMIPYSPKNDSQEFKVPTFEKNRGKIEDMYAFAYGVANKLVKNDGIIAYITSNTILTLPSYKWLRKFLLENYTIHYIINFNRIMEKSNSLFSPEAAIATSIILLSKRIPQSNHKLRYLDLSTSKTIREKYEIFNDISWQEKGKDKNDIVSFVTKDIGSLNFIEFHQEVFFENFDFEFIKPDSLLKLIEYNTDKLRNYGVFSCGISTANDKIFISDSEEKLKQQIESFTTNLNLEYVFSNEHIKEYIHSKYVNNYFVKKTLYIYYDERLIDLWRKHCKNESKSFNARFGDVNKLNSQIKLIITAHSAYVDNKGRYPSLNCIDGKNTYFLNGNENTLYYICSIFNSNLGFYYRNKKNIDNYEIFPIKKIKGKEDIFNQIAKFGKELHELNDVRQIIMGEHKFEPSYFENDFIKKVEFYSIEEPNRLFSLQIPNTITPDLTICNPGISETNVNEIILNQSGLKLVCIDKDIAKSIFEQYLFNVFGDLNELNLLINITTLNEKSRSKLVTEITQEIEKIKDIINILVYSLYFNLTVEVDKGTIKNEEKIWENIHVIDIEEYIKNS